MSWTLDKTTGIWKCSKYSDLNYAEVTNLAEYGQPMSPYERGFDHDFIPDFSKVIVMMPQSEVMTNGYGKNIEADTFPIVKKFLDQALTLPYGSYSFNDLVRLKFAEKSDRWIRTNLYGWGKYGISAGDISAGDAAYIHGTVSMALMSSTQFTYRKASREVNAEIGAGDDNWDFNSATIPTFVNATVGTLFGPDHYNLTAPLQIRFEGPGKRSIVSRVSAT